MSSLKQWTVSAETDLSTIAEELLPLRTKYNIWLLYGDLGAGKTTFVKKLLQGSGVEGEITSPTYAIVNEYDTDQLGRIYHMDLYRLNTIEEIWEIGLEEYLYSGRLCLIEWPEIVINFIEEPYLRLEFTILSDDYRKISCTEVCQ